MYVPESSSERPEMERLNAREIEMIPSPLYSDQLLARCVRLRGKRLLRNVKVNSQDDDQESAISFSNLMRSHPRTDLE